MLKSNGPVGLAWPSKAGRRNRVDDGIVYKIQKVNREEEEEESEESCE